MRHTRTSDMVPVCADLDEVRRKAQRAAEALWVRAAA